MISNQTNYSSMRAAVLQWIQIYSGLGVNSVNWINQESGKLAKPFATLYEHQEDSELGLPAFQQFFNQDTQLLETYYGKLRLLRITAEIYSNPAKQPTDIEAWDYLRNALSVIRSIEVQQIFNKANLSLITYSNARRLDEIFDYRWERRVSVDLLFNYAEVVYNDGASTDYLDTVTLMTTSEEGALVNTIGDQSKEDVGILDFSQPNNSKMIGAI